MVHSPVSAQPLNEIDASLSPTQQDELRRGEPVVTASGSHYVGRVVISGTPETAWNVVADYENFEVFLPSVVSSRVLEGKGDRKVVEQVVQQKVFLVDFKSSLQTENVEVAPQRIDFQLLQGDFETFEGHWQISPVRANDNSAQQVMITQAVDAEAGVGLFEGNFGDLFMESMRENMVALRAEVERRSQSS